jgi:hypothetical protein
MFSTILGIPWFLASNISLYYFIDYSTNMCWWSGRSLGIKKVLIEIRCLPMLSGFRNLYWCLLETWIENWSLALLLRAVLKIHNHGSQRIKKNSFDWCAPNNNNSPKFAKDLKTTANENHQFFHETHHRLVSGHILLPIEMTSCWAVLRIGNRDNRPLMVLWFWEAKLVEPAVLCKLK